MNFKFNAMKKILDKTIKIFSINSKFYNKRVVSEAKLLNYE